MSLPSALTFNKFSSDKSPFCKVFLCVSKDHVNFECKEFQSFLAADEYFEKKYPSKNDVKCSAMLTSCKFMPESLRMYNMNKKLERMFNPSFKTKIVDQF